MPENIFKFSFLPLGVRFHFDWLPKREYDIDEKFEVARDAGVLRKSRLIYSSASQLALVHVI